MVTKLKNLKTYKQNKIYQVVAILIGRNRKLNTFNLFPDITIKYEFTVHAFSSTDISEQNEIFTMKRPCLRKPPPTPWQLMVTFDYYNETIPWGILGFSGKVIRLWNDFYLYRITQHRKKRTYTVYNEPSLRPWGHCDGLHIKNSRLRFLWLVLSGSPIKCSYTKPWNSVRPALQLLILRLLFMFSIFIYPVAGERQRYSCLCSLII